MWHWRTCWLLACMALWLGFQGCFVSPLQPCNPHDPRFTVATCPCQTDQSCPALMTCQQGFCSFQSKESSSPDSATLDQPPSDTKTPDPTTAPDLPIAEQSPDLPTPDAAFCDEGTRQACYTGPSESQKIGECKAGAQECRGGRWSACIGEVTPKPEICDGLDNNCDGQIDELPPRDCYSGPPETINKGLCTQGKQSCLKGSWSACVGEQGPTAEVCDGTDNNCNGKVDDVEGGCQCTGGVAEPCYSGAPGTAGKGPCKAGTRTCQSGKWSACVGSIGPSTEVCDGLDNDCDGQADESLTRTCQSICGNGTETCSKGTWGTCTAPTPQAEICDNKDNDCNGQIDDGVANIPCYSGAPGTEGVGPCIAGTQACSRGVWGRCVGEIKPQTESCNGKDDDCDGQIDEAGACGTCTAQDARRTCGSAVGTCQQGQQLCVNGLWQACTGSVGPSTEVCDGLDNDCDGQIDNGATAQMQIDTFIAPTSPKTDLLFVIDSSCSMLQYQQELSAAVSSLMSRITQLNADYQLGVITMDLADQGYLQGTPKIVTPQTPNASSVFQKNANVGIRGVGPEVGLELAKRALSAPAITSQNAGFLRADAMLILIFISDEPDNGTSPTSSYIQFFQGLKPTNPKELLRAFVLGDARYSGGSLSCSRGSASECARYIDVINALGGNHLRISQSSNNISRFFEGIVDTTVGRLTSYRLQHRPDPTTITVQINGQTVPQSPTNGWQYSSDFRIVQFFGTASPKGGEAITVSYTEKCGP